MVAPLAVGDIEIEIIDKLIYVPYVEMTLKLMERFGVTVKHTGNWNKFFIKGCQKYKFPCSAYVEGDASSASYFLVGAAVTGGTITVEGCGTSSLQCSIEISSDSEAPPMSDSASREYETDREGSDSEQTLDVPAEETPAPPHVTYPMFSYAAETSV
ncbi:hypothetical protein AgCh_021950 [Apium graveolens]